ncbi:Oidioi.mRNA.OKI2018_I69.chr2.g8208.t1.cds [Oikopleura dioica]|uniref:Oidioi.mRNA.OKI2018_I69.chr2.g8208.t1.cds n=1 Tax=Oikopleura dioica TaxID=34765 RepID=A0ABN7TEV3_OIKDI|nr:Oidioi.mRNA.OKI2018_I69.chr2.g8208.t1.cds [Oikopleura dioica]
MRIIRSLVMFLSATYGSDDFVRRLNAKKENHLKFLKEKISGIIESDESVTDGNRSRIDPRKFQAINRLMDSDPNMFTNNELSEMIYQITDTREREWTIKMAPPGRGSKVKNMQFKVQSKPSYVNPKCSKHCKMNFRIQFSGKTPSGEHFRRSEVIERELPKGVLGCPTDHCQAFTSLNFETEDPLPKIFDAYDSAVKDHSTDLKIKISPFGGRLNVHLQDIWVVVNYESKGHPSRHRRDTAKFHDDNNRNCGLRRVEVDLDEWYPHLKNVVYSPKKFTFTFCEGSCEAEKHYMARNGDDRFDMCCHAVESTHLEMMLFDSSVDGYRHENSPSMLAQSCKCL